MLFLSVRGFLDYAGPDNPLAINVVVVLPSSTRNRVGVLFHRLFEAQSPGPPIPLSTLQAPPRDIACKTRGQDGFAASFPVGLFHPLQHAGLSRRTPSSRPSGQNRCTWLWIGASLRILGEEESDFRVPTSLSMRERSDAEV